MKHASLDRVWPSLLGLVFALVGFWKTAYSQESRLEVTIVTEHRSPWQIVSLSRSVPGVAFAVAELQKYVEHLSGARLPIAKQPPGGPVIVVGLRADLSAEDRALLPPPAPGHDGYAVAVRAGVSARIVIGGDNGRGVLHGVYDLLERWGCRWFYPTQDARDPEVVPQTPSLVTVAGSWAIASPMQFRIYNGDAWYFDVQPEAAIQQVDHAAKLRCNLIGWQCAHDKPLLQQYQGLQQQGVLSELEKRALTLHGPAHSFNLFLPNEQFALHPEWFGMRGGRRVTQSFLGAQFCWSNADAREAFCDNVASFAQQTPLIRILVLVPFDGGVACDCPECRQTGASNSLMTMSTSSVIPRGTGGTTA